MPIRTVSLAALLCLAAASGAHAAEREFRPVTDAMLRNPDPADWLMWRRTLDAWGYSPLDEINRRNVARLEVAWSIDLDAAPSQEGTPIVHDGVLYFPGPSDVTLALDAATGKKLWEHRRALPEDLGKFVPFPQTNRNLAIYDRLIIDNGADNTIYALDAVTGKQVWEHPVFDYHVSHVKQGSAPFVVAGKLISGRNCQPQGGPDACVITAHDARTGKELWRKRTIPKPGEPGGDSWGDVPDGDRWHVGAWMMPSYDPELNLIYMGTSVTAPAPKFMLAGNDKQYLYHNSTLALRPETGEIVWYYQHVVDHWDLDHPFERILLDEAVAPDKSEVPWINPRLKPGEKRKVVTGIPGKTGLIYTLDRATGEFLWARPTIFQNVITDIDGATGKVTVNEKSLFTAADQTRFICPTTNGGKNWPAGAYSPRTKTMYMPMQNTCMNATATASAADRRPERLYAFTGETMIAPDADGKVGTVRAFAAETGKSVWRFDTRAGVMALVATGGDLVFGGDVAGNFRAFDATTGKVLWETNLGSQVTGHPITFSAGGRQYVAVSTGRSNVTGGLSRLTPDVAPDDSRNRLFVFALPK
ncbi:MAG TPA: PQQ-binding-like beta-propeller repeat protein [Gammaproteobacteria bacterium]|jgi:alcohol dehydrogenase (cytochrome c)|nr:PQQ-binding-like beta-propeller repeat protein [Gammaproteobacteria bacterium]